MGPGVHEGPFISEPQRQPSDNCAGKRCCFLYVNNIYYVRLFQEKKEVSKRILLH